MTLDDFIQKYDFNGSVVLLEGKRDVADADKSKLINLGKLLAEKTEHMIFRSGNAEGADYYFSKGVAEVDADRLEVIIPYSNHRKNANIANKTYDLDNIDLEGEKDVIEQSMKNKKLKNLISKYVSGVRNRNTIKAAYIIRDTVKVIGTSTISKASFAIFYDDLDKPKIGGTGHTIL
ncbi:hypothetical protein, partial [Flexistipes sinusarabici]|uniref:hypothetical protein n=1 Tax=Flexistipes sinusarabici TaxID=2352 RepID=UPI002354D569